MKGSDTITGGIIIMPSDISAALTTMSITRNGMKMMKPMMNACFSSLRMNAGISVVSATSARFSGLRPVRHLGEQRDLLVAGLVQHEAAQRVDAVVLGLGRVLVPSR